MKNLIKFKSFKEFIESVGRGCKMITANIENNLIAVYCKANSQNNIIFKILLNKDECVDLINSYDLYSKEEFSLAYQKYLNELKAENSI